jgi:tRNA G18 (ribose-2'-O)-methylase SpoU
VEGLQLLHMALDSGARPIEAFYCESQVMSTEAASLLSRFLQTDADLITVSESVMRPLSHRTSSKAIVATFAMFETSLQGLELTGRDLVVVLHRLQSPVNLGTLIRSAPPLATGHWSGYNANGETEPILWKINRDGEL